MSENHAASMGREEGKMAFTGGKHKDEWARSRLGAKHEREGNEESEGRAGNRNTQKARCRKDARTQRERRTEKKVSHEVG